jgi:formate-dependent nitrite reductase cytochrome c552 subunit
VCHRESEETFRSTKQKAQQYLELDVVQFSKDKDKFKKEVIPLFSPH